MASLDLLYDAGTLCCRRYVRTWRSTVVHLRCRISDLNLRLPRYDTNCNQVFMIIHVYKQGVTIKLLSFYMESSLCRLVVSPVIFYGLLFYGSWWPKRSDSVNCECFNVRQPKLKLYQARPCPVINESKILDLMALHIRIHV